MILPGSPGIVCSTCSTGSPGVLRLEGWWHGITNRLGLTEGIWMTYTWHTETALLRLSHLSHPSPARVYLQHRPMAYDGVFLALWPMPIQVLFWNQLAHPPILWNCNYNFSHVSCPQKKPAAALPKHVPSIFPGIFPMDISTIHWSPCRA